MPVEDRVVPTDAHVLLARGVDQVLINKQCGWRASSRPEEAARARLAVASRTGLSIYIDVTSDLLDARRSAEAVGEILDDAVERLEEHMSQPVAHEMAHGTKRAG